MVDELAHDPQRVLAGTSGQGSRQLVDLGQVGFDRPRVHRHDVVLLLGPKLGRQGPLLRFQLGQLPPDRAGRHRAFRDGIHQPGDLLAEITQPPFGLHPALRLLDGKPAALGVVLAHGLRDQLWLAQVIPQAFDDRAFDRVEVDLAPVAAGSRFADATAHRDGAAMVRSGRGDAGAAHGAA